MELEFRIFVLFCNTKMKCDEISEAQGEDPDPDPESYISLKSLTVL